MMYVPRRKETYGPPWPVTGTVSLFICRWCSYLTGSTPMDLHGLLQEQFHFLYVDDVRISQETQIRTSTAYCGISASAYFEPEWRCVGASDMRGLGFDDNCMMRLRIHTFCSAVESRKRHKHIHKTELRQFEQRVAWTQIVFVVYLQFFCFFNPISVSTAGIKCIFHVKDYNNSPPEKHKTSESM
jgi:hypothetical protein